MTQTCKTVIDGCNMIYYVKKCFRKRNLHECVKVLLLCIDVCYVKKRPITTCLVNDNNTGVIELPFSSEPYARTFHN